VACREEWHREKRRKRMEPLWRAQLGVCALTGDAIPFETMEGVAEIDHIRPRSRGGSDDVANLRLVIRAANRAKGDMLDEEFFTLCEKVWRAKTGAVGA
jgi:CRISPR/Cas system Type II protein with McrA/HNH and RuvC-like nuclease domain